MSEMISKALLSGLGLANLTKEAVQKTVENLSRKSNLSEEEGRRMMKDLHRRSAMAQKNMEKSVELAVNKLLKNLHLNMALVHERAKPAKTARTARTARTAKTRGKGARKATAKRKRPRRRSSAA
jgi:polyhydroxyalkanoate synthesis regulator phasin